MSSNAELDFQGFLRKVEAFSNIAITAPAGADGDSVGTQCALRELLQTRLPGKRIRVVNEEPCPVRYRFVESTRAFEVSADLLKGERKDWPDLMICVDGGSQRIGDDTTKLWAAARGHAQVDHHAIGAAGEYEFRLYDPRAAATTEIVFEMARALGVKLTPTMAQAIYIGLVFDTGLFKHSNTRPETLRIGAMLLETGFDHTETAEKAMLIRSEGALQMLRHVLNHMHFECGARYVWSVLEHKAFMEAGGDADDREGLIDNLFLTRACEVAAFYFERRPNEWKISFRSRAKRDVAALAQSLSPQGGGHRQAAGCSLSGSQQEVLARCHGAVKKLLES